MTCTVCRCKAVAIYQLGWFSLRLCQHHIDLLRRLLNEDLHG